VADDKLTRVPFDELEVQARDIVQKAREAERELAWNELRRVMRRVTEVEKGFEELHIKVSQLESARDSQRLEIQMAVASGEITSRMAARLEFHIEEHAQTIAQHTEAISRFSPLKVELEALYEVCAKLSEDNRELEKSQKMLAEDVGDRD
jgi:chromosome segregation ATPase